MFVDEIVFVMILKMVKFVIT